MINQNVSPEIECLNYGFSSDTKKVGIVAMCLFVSSLRKLSFLCLDTKIEQTHCGVECGCSPLAGGEQLVETKMEESNSKN